MMSKARGGGARSPPAGRKDILNNSYLKPVQQYGIEIQYRHSPGSPRRAEGGAHHDHSRYRGADRSTGQGPAGRSARAGLQRGDRGLLDRARLQHGRDARPDRGHRRRAQPGHAHRVVPADAVHRGRLPRAEQGRPGLRHHVHLDGPRIRAADRLDGRLGDHRGRHHRDGQPGPDRRAVLPGTRRSRVGRRRLGDGGGRRVHRPAHRGLLPRDRGVGPATAGPAGHRGGRAGGLRGRRAGQGRHRARAARSRAAVMATLMLVAIFAVISIAALAYAGPAFLAAHSTDVLGAMATSVLGSTPGKLLVLCVLTSTAASTQTTIMPTARAVLAMSAHGALPAWLARMHPRYRTPTTATLVMGGTSAAFFVLLTSVSKNVLADSAASVGLLIAFYYGLTGFACVWFFRRELLTSAHALLVKGILPLIGGLTLLGAFVLSIKSYWPAASSYSSFHGIGGIFLIGAGSLVIGVIVMLITARFLPRYFAEGIAAHDRAE